MTKFTPAPWTVGLSPTRGVLCVTSPTTWICGELQADNKTSIPDVETTANAHLIAAAPDLYASLIEISEMLWSRPDISNKLHSLMGFAEKATFERASAALAKARGEP